MAIDTDITCIFVFGRECSPAGILFGDFHERLRAKSIPIKRLPKDVRTRGIKSLSPPFLSANPKTTGGISMIGRYVQRAKSTSARR